MIIPALFDFFRELSTKSRDWFNERCVYYELHVKLLLLKPSTKFVGTLETISYRFIDILKVDSPLFQVYEDVRSSKDKRPHKEAAEAHFWYVAGKDVYAPGFYFHLARCSLRLVFGGVGRKELFMI